MLLEILIGIALAGFMDNYTNDFLALVVILALCIIVKLALNTEMSYWMLVGVVIYYVISGWFSCAMCEHRAKYA